MKLRDLAGSMPSPMTCRLSLTILSLAAASALIAGTPAHAFEAGERELDETQVAEDLSQAPAQAPGTIPRVQPSTPTQTPQQRDVLLRQQDVTDREHQQYSPLGVRAGSFFFFPRVELREQVTDNVYRTRTDQRTDFITTVAPSLGVRSNFSQHEIVAYAGADVIRFHKYDREDVENFDSYLSGRYDLGENTYLTGRAIHSIYHETRDSPDDVGSKEPGKITLSGFDAGGQYQPGRVRVKTNFAYRYYDFFDTESFGGGKINNDDRDRSTMEYALRAGYEIIPKYYAFVEGVVNSRDYRTAFDDSGFNRDSKGFSIRAGTDIELTGVLRGDIYAGWLRQSYDDARFENISGYDAGVNLTWSVTGLTTVKVSFARTVEETTTTLASGALQTKAEFRVDHELQRNIVLSAGGGWANNEYKGIRREDDVYRGEVSGTYKLDRNFYGILGYRYSERNSSVVSEGYRDNSVMLILGAQL
jgi:hypothetical protein